MDTRDSLVPDSLDTDTAANRYLHLDLDGLSDTDLEDEYHCLRGQLWHLPPEHWLRERVKALEGEMAKRHRPESIVEPQKRQLATGFKV